MLTKLAKSLELLAALVTKAPAAPDAPRQMPAYGFADHFRRIRDPRPQDLLAELKTTAYTCAVINANNVPQYKPRLYVVTRHHEPKPKCLTKALDAKSTI